jgi:hypothetical protein
MYGKGVAVQTRLDHLIDAIDRLVDEQLAGGELGQDRCWRLDGSPLCLAAVWRA